LVGSELGRPVAIDAHPKYSVALGAAIVAAGQDVADAVDHSQVAAIPEPPSLATTALPPAPRPMPTPVAAAVSPPRPAAYVQTAAPNRPAPAAPVAHQPYQAHQARHAGHPVERPAGPKRGRGGLWLVLLLAGAVAGYFIYDGVLASEDEPPSQFENIDNETMASNCRLGSMRSCDRLYQAMEEDPERDNAADRMTSATCGGVADGGMFGTCEEEFGAEVEVTTTTSYSTGG
jgi:hypothetical protein